MSLLRNLSFVTESPPLLPIRSLSPTPLRSRLPSISSAPGGGRGRSRTPVCCCCCCSLSCVHAMILLFSWLAVDVILVCGESSCISFRFASSLFGGVRGGGGGEPAW